MAFRVSMAPVFFQREMLCIVEGLPSVVNLVDDILVFGATETEHDVRPKSTLARLEEAGITLNEDTRINRSREVTLLGVVSARGISPDLEKGRAVRDPETPTSVSGLRGILGMVNRLARFIPSLSHETAPLRSFLHKDNSWN